MLHEYARKVTSIHGDKSIKSNWKRNKSIVVCCYTYRLLGNQRSDNHTRTQETTVHILFLYNLLQKICYSSNLQINCTSCTTNTHHYNTLLEANNATKASQTVKNENYHRITEPDKITSHNTLKMYLIINTILIHNNSMIICNAVTSCTVKIRGKNQLFPPQQRKQGLLLSYVHPVTTNSHCNASCKNVPTFTLQQTARHFNIFHTMTLFQRISKMILRILEKLSFIRDM